MSESSETIKLSHIYRTLLDDLIDLSPAYDSFPSAEYNQAVQLISDAVGSALNVLSQRCPRCDDNELECRSCGWVQNK